MILASMRPRLFWPRKLEVREVFEAPELGFNEAAAVLAAEGHPRCRPATPHPRGFNEAAAVLAAEVFDMPFLPDATRVGFNEAAAVLAAEADIIGHRIPPVTGASMRPRLFWPRKPLEGVAALMHTTALQ